MAENLELAVHEPDRRDALVHLECCAHLLSANLSSIAHPPEVYSAKACRSRVNVRLEQFARIPRFDSGGEGEMWKCALISLASLCFTGIPMSAPAAACAFTASSLCCTCWASPCEQRGAPQARFPQEPQLFCTSVHLRGGGASGEHDEHDLWWQQSRAAATSLLNLERILLEAQSAAQPENDDSDAIPEEDSKEDVADMAMQDCVRRFKFVLAAPPYQKAGALAGQSLRCLSSSPFVCPCTSLAQTGADGRRASAVVALTQFLHTFFVGTDKGMEKGDGDGCTLLQDGEWPGGAANTVHTNRLGGNSARPEVCAEEDARKRISSEPVDGMRAREAVCEALALDMIVLLAPLEACCVCGNRVRSILHAFVSVGDRRSRLGTMMGALELLARAGLHEVHDAVDRGEVRHGLVEGDEAVVVVVPEREA